MADVQKPSSRTILASDGKLEFEWQTFFDRLAKDSYLCLLQPFLRANVPSTAPPGAMIYVTDAVGGGVPAFFDGSSWLRVDTRGPI